MVLRTRRTAALDVDPDGADCVHGSETAIIANKSLAIFQDLYKDFEWHTRMLTRPARQRTRYLEKTDLFIRCKQPAINPALPNGTTH